MPITLKKDEWKVKDPSSGNYRGAAILSTTLPEDAAQIIEDTQDALDAEEVRAGQIINDAQNAVDGIEGQSTIILESIAKAIQDGNNYELIDTAVESWLDTHPEATTSVEDHSLTYEKLVNGTLGFVTPQMYGAKGDGVTDDTQSIQNALNASHVVYIPDGVYLINGNNSGFGHITEGGIFPRTNTIILLSNNAVLKAKTNNTGFYNIINLDDIDNVFVYGGKIQGEKDTHVGDSGEFGYGVRISECTNISIQNMEIYDCWGDGIIIDSADELTGENKHIVIENCVIHDCRRQGISVIIGTDIVIDKCEIYNITAKMPKSGIDIEPNGRQYITDVRITNSYIHDTVGGSILIANDYVKDIIIDSNYLMALNIVGGDKIIVSNSHINDTFRICNTETNVSNCTIARIDIEGGNAIFDNCIIDGNISTYLTLVYIGRDNVSTKISDFVKFIGCTFKTKSDSTYILKIPSGGTTNQEKTVTFYDCRMYLGQACKFCDRLPSEKFILQNCEIYVESSVGNMFTVGFFSPHTVIKIIGTDIKFTNKASYLLSSDSTALDTQVMISNCIISNYGRLMHAGSGNTGDIMMLGNVLMADYPYSVSSSGITVTQAYNVSSTP